MGRASLCRFQEMGGIHQQEPDPDNEGDDRRQSTTVAQEIGSGSMGRQDRRRKFDQNIPALVYGNIPVPPIHYSLTIIRGWANG